MGLLSKFSKMFIKLKAEELQAKVLNGDFTDYPFSHPDLTDSILSNILGNLEFENLKTCRLVCTRWDKVLRETEFTDEKICFQFCLFENKKNIRRRSSSGSPLPSSSAKANSSQLLNPSPPESDEDDESSPVMPKLKVSTLRIKDTTRDPPRKSGPSPSILNLSRVHPCLLDGLTRLEIQPLAYPTAHNLWNLYQVLMVFPLLNNIVELIIAQPEKLDWSHPTGFDFSLETLERKYKVCKYYNPNYMKLRKLKKLVFSVDNSDTPEYFMFLKAIAEICEKLEDFQIFINYSKIWPVQFARLNLFKFIGMILEHNAKTLENVVIRTRNTFWCEEKLNLTRFDDSYNDAVRNSLEHGSWYLNYSSYATNEMFVAICQEMKMNRWEYFGLNALKNLTLEFPLPVLPCPEIDSGLKPFLNSLTSLKSLKIQPIMAKQMQNLGEFTYEPMTYLNGILENPKFKFESDLIFFADSNEIDWTPLTWRCQRSRMDMVWKKEGPETKFVNYSPKRLLLRNVSWKNVNLAESLVPQRFANLIHLGIHQNTSCTLGHVLSLDDLDLQLILRNGRSLQYLALSCDLSKVTPFGYTGYIHPVPGCDSLFVMRKICSLDRISILPYRIGHAFLDLKDLKTLILIGLKTHSKVEPTREEKKAELDLIYRYFLNVDKIQYMLFGFEGIVKCTKDERIRLFLS